MTRFAPVASSLLLIAFLLAGCSGGDDEPSTSPSPSSTSTTTASSSSPGVATGVDITRAPSSSPAASMALVCWEVFGTGKVAHVAIHWDNVSHADEPARAFADYDLGASYPGNESSASPNGYALQPTGAEFCTSATMPASGSIFVVGHVIDSTGAPGRLSAEREVRVGAASEAMLHIEGFSYSPNPLTVAPGAHVTVMNMDAQTHTATGTGGAFDSGDIAGGATGAFTAPMQAGSYPFGCAYHTGMSGVLQVVAA
jgi:plastocyanin